MDQLEWHAALSTLANGAAVAEAGGVWIDGAALRELPAETWSAVLPAAADNIVECAEGDGPAEFVDWDRVAVDVGLVEAAVVVAGPSLA